MDKFTAISDFFYRNIQRNAETFPDKPAVIDGEGNTALYKDVLHTYERMRGFIKTNGIEPWRRFAFATDDSLSLALLQPPLFENAVVSHIDRSFPEEKARYYLELINHDYVITDDENDYICRIARDIGMGIIVFFKRGIRGELEYSFEITAEPSERIGGRHLKKPEQVLIGTTSGTTAVPKIVPIDFNILINCIKGNLRTYDLNKDDVMFEISKLTRNIGINSLLGALTVGATVILTDGFRHLQCVNIFDNHRVTTFTASPAVYESFLGYLENSGTTLRCNNLRFVRTTGAPLSEVLKKRIEAVFKTVVVQTYGMTETKGIACTFKSPYGYREGSSGTSIGLDIKIVNDEILVRGDTVFPGYENEEIDNAIYFDEGWFRTGDTGYVDDDGYVFVTGRIKEMINRGGEKVSPYEVEKAILSLGRAKEAVVFPYPNQYGSDEVGAAVVLSDKVYYNLEELRLKLSQIIQSFKMPTILFVVPEIPVGNGGKIQRKKIYDQLADKYPEYLVDGASMGKTEKSRKTVSSTERKVAGIWKKALYKIHVDHDVSFTHQGGDSLSGSVILSKIEHKFGVNVPINVLFDGGTVKSLSAYIDGACADSFDYRFMVPIRSEGSRKPLICVHAAKGDAETYNQLAKGIGNDIPVYALRFVKKGCNWEHPVTFEQMSKAYADEIMRFDPEGPYNLCGNCYGGVLALAVANEIKSRGGRIGLLAMLDSTAREGRGKKKKKRGSILRMFKRSIRTNLKTLKHIKFRELPYFIYSRTRGMITYFSGRLQVKIYSTGVARKSSLLMRAGGSAGPLRYSFAKYRPEAYEGKITFVYAVNSADDIEERYKYWMDKASDFELIQIECEHNDLVRRQNAGEVAQRLREILDRDYA